MPKKTKGPRQKHIPQRTCVGCRVVLAKRTLTRLVRTVDGVRIDPSGKMSGRGAYLHNQRTCWEKGLKGALAQALKTELTDDDRIIIFAFMEALPEIAPTSEGQVNGG